MNVLVFSSLFPNKIQPNNAIFIKNRMAAVAKQRNYTVKVVAPVPYFPPLPLADKLFIRWRHFTRIPKHEFLENLEIWHPRYIVTPKIGMSFYGLSMFLGTLPLLKKIYSDFPFDLIDGHYIYPDGLAAILAGRMFRVPVVLSARGTDINLYPQFPLIKKIIQYTLKKTNKCIAVCEDLKKIMMSLGIEDEKINVIPNGIDQEQFYRIEKSAARGKIGLPVRGKVLLAVGSLIERKGHHLLIDALGIMKKENRLSFVTYIVGEGEWHDKLAIAIKRNNLDEYVFLQGQVDNKDLLYWYNAADLFFLGSSREGWPNVISESLACGVPVIATSVNGVPEIINSDDYGVVLKERTASYFAQEIPKAMNRSWDYDKIYQYGQSRTWDTVAAEVCSTFAEVMEVNKC